MASHDTKNDARKTPTDGRVEADKPGKGPGEAAQRDLAPKADQPTNQATRMGHSPRQQFGKLTLEHDANAGTVTFVGEDGCRIPVDQSDFDAMVVAHREDSEKGVGNSPPVKR